MEQFYKNKHVLVTAGPTWTKVDRVRVLTTIFSGETGLQLARYFTKLGARVTLLMGPGRAKFEKEDWITMDIHQFFYYDDLDDLLKRMLTEKTFDIIVHSAAVADYKPSNYVDRKIPSGQEGLAIHLSATKKLIDYIRREAPHSFLVKFKLQVGMTEEELLEVAYSSLLRSDAQLIVANDLEGMSQDAHTAYIIDTDQRVVSISNKEEMSEKLASAIFSKMAQ